MDTLVTVYTYVPVYQVPAFVYSPSHIPEELWGTEYHGLMHVTDWLPTLADAANFELLGRLGTLKKRAWVVIIL